MRLSISKTELSPHKGCLWLCNHVHCRRYPDGFDVAWHPEGSAAAAAIDGMVQVMDMQQAASFAYTLGNLGRVRSVAFNPQGTWLVAGGGETGGGMMGSIYSWAWSHAMTTEREAGWDNYRVLGGHAHDVTQVSFLPDGSYLLSASHDGSIRMWDYLNTGCEISRLQL